MTWFDNQDSITQIVTTRAVADLFHDNDAIVCAIALLHDPGIDRDRVLNVLIGIMRNRHIAGAPIEAERLTDFARHECSSAVYGSVITVLRISGIAFGFPPTDHSAAPGGTWRRRAWAFTPAAGIKDFSKFGLT